MKFFNIFMILLLLLSGCVSRKSLIGKSRMESVEQPEPPPAEMRAGKVSLSSKSEETYTRERYIPVYPRRRLIEPTYPPIALAAGGRPYTIYVTFSVDEHGQIFNIHRSWRQISQPNEFSEAFYAAVCDAMTKWALAPAREETWQYVSGKDAGECLRSEPVCSTIEMKFEFSASEEQKTSDVQKRKRSHKNQ